MVSSVGFRMNRGPQKRLIELGDSDDVFIEVLAGFNEGEEVILNPAALLKEAEEDALTTLKAVACRER